MLEIKYYPSKDDPMWNAEVEKLIPYMDGFGLDVGCGKRTVYPEMKRLDIDPTKEPDYCSSMDKIPAEDETFHFVSAVHAFEHVEDQKATLKEWLRVLKPRGYILIVHPDVKFTGKQKPLKDNPSMQEDPYNKHYDERTLDEMVEWMTENQNIGYTLIDYGVACGNWSFYIILRKTA